MAKQILAFYYRRKCEITEFKTYNMRTQMVTFITIKCKTKLQTITLSYPRQCTGLS